jgi:lipoprotein-anchoring transpeptidase ErfK/SrfK
MTIDTSQYLTLGISAARAGQKREARQYFKAVLKQTPHHVPALFWMAFVAPTPEASLDLFERVLKLDPDNERAQAGISWAEKQIGLAAESRPEVDVATDTNEKPSDETLFTRDQFLSAPEIQEQSQKGVRAHRARRTINPFLAMLLLFGAAALIMFGGYSLLTQPTETLAAWRSGTVADVQQAVVNPIHDDGFAVPVAHRQSAFDTLTGVTKPVSAAEAPQMRLEPITLAAVDVPPVAQPEIPVVVNFTPDEMVGPVGQVHNNRKLFVPVDENLLAHTPASADEKWIEVDLSAQTLTAWEGKVPVMAFLTSTGLPGTPTVQGEFNIYWKLESTLMAGPGYYLPEVPYTMYFYNGYGLHGAYWHNNFGQPMSHGCVNLRNEDSKTLFEWADPVIPAGETQVVASVDNPGTLVVVHE